MVRQPLLVLDRDGNVRLADPGFCRTFQALEGEVLGRPLAQISGGAWERAGVTRLVTDPPANGDEVREAVVEEDFAPIGRRRLVVTARRIDAESGDDPLVLVAVDDVTEGSAPGRRRDAGAEESLGDERRAREEAEAASRAKDAFLATLSHELRTPLTSMLGWVSMLRGGRLDPATVNRALAALERNTKVQVQLIEDLLDVSRVTSGKFRIDFRPVDLAAVARAAADVVRPAALAKGVRLVVQAAPGVTVLGDRDRLQQAAWNLLSNAIRFTPRDGEIRLSVSRANGQAELSVRDTGAGIPSQLLPQVFDRFRQLGGNATPPHGGLGLGLVIVRHIVELHGGVVRAESDGRNEGSTFTINVPLAPRAGVETVEDAAAGPPVLVGEASLTGENVLAGVQVLLAEDEPDARDMLAAALAHYGAQATAVGSVREALAALGRQVPDVLVADIAMPEEDGYVLIRRVRALPYDRGGRVPALALTAYARAEDVEQAKAAGFNVHLAKPIEPAVLALTVAQLAGPRTGR
ncbi:MAG TPA: ATP-binding protein [Thermodesulfobacteriota bacterium]